MTEYWTHRPLSHRVKNMRTGPSSGASGLAAKPGPWGDLALTLPVFLAYQLGVVFLNVRNASDVVTAQLIELARGDRLLYCGLTAAMATAMVGVFAVLGRGQVLRARKLVQVVIEGASYAAVMGATTSWVVGKMFAGPTVSAVGGPFAGFVMSLGAGFYEELAFRVVLFGLGAKVLVALLGKKRVPLLHGGRGGGSAGSVASAGPYVKVFTVVATWALLCAAMFSGMHYIGALGDSFDARSFVARAVLGMALTVVYVTRGFAAAVWTHALYDVWVLVF